MRLQCGVVSWSTKFWGRWKISLGFCDKDSVGALSEASQEQSRSSCAAFSRIASYTGTIISSISLPKNIYSPSGT